MDEGDDKDHCSGNDNAIRGSSSETMICCSGKADNEEGYSNDNEAPTAQLVLTSTYNPRKSNVLLSSAISPEGGGRLSEKYSATRAKPHTGRLMSMIRRGHGSTYRNTIACDQHTYLNAAYQVVFEVNTPPSTGPSAPAIA